MLYQYYQMVIQTNKQFNLTAITDEDEFAIKHILDSVLPNQFLPLNATVIDIGAGAGFPSIPLKIIRPDLQITMIDSLNKRVNFLNYYYVLHKIFEIKNNLEFMKYCPLLKSTDKLIQQDMIWKQICKKLNWKYIPSI